MNEPFDAELSKAFKEGAAKSLEGWEFTPAMRAKVLDQARAEVAEAASRPPQRQFRPMDVVRPLTWVAAAAAAFLIVTNLGHFGGASTNSKPMAESKSAADRAAAKSAAPTAAPVPATGNAVAQKAAADAPAVPYSAASAAPEVAATHVETTATSAMTSTAAGMADTALPTVVAMDLTVPAAKDGEAAMAPPQGAPLKSRALAPTPENLSMATNSNGPVVALTPFGLKATNTDGGAAWDRPLADLNRQSLLAQSPDGRAAVANGANLLYLVNQRGELEHTVYGSATIQKLLWSNDGRVAAAEGSNVTVYDGVTGRSTFTVDAGAGADIAFAADGLLAIYGDRPNDPHRLVLLDRVGVATVEVRPAVAGRGLAFAANGAVIVAGGQAYSRVGKSLWQMGIQTDGVAALGADLIVGWNAQMIMAVRASDGKLVWKADWKGAEPGIRKVAVSPDGRYTAVVAPQEDGGAVLWVLDSTGRLRYSERLGQMPTDVSFVGEQLVLLQPQSVEYRSIPQE